MAIIPPISYPFSGAFSIGTSKRPSLGDKSKALFPGPGAYFSEILASPNTSRASQSKATIPHSPRLPIFDGSTAPPPGTYDIASTMGQGQKISISKMRYKEYGDKYEIGPGSYDVLKGFENKTQMPISFTAKYEDPKPLVNVPGPGTYEISQSFIKESPRFNKSLHSSNLSGSTLHLTKHTDVSTFITPGPGEYQTFSPSSKSTGTTFAKSARRSLKNNNTPGPGSFEINSPKQKPQGKHFTLGSKIPIKDSFSQFVPGPGAYNLSQNISKNSIKIGSSSRRGFPSADTPGPGSYIQSEYFLDETYLSSPQNRGLSYSKRPDLVKIENSPGPGNYEIPETIGQSGSARISQTSMPSKFNVKTNYPGPGSYNVSQNIIDSHRGTSIQNKHDTTAQSINPGPGAYDASFNFGGPKYSFTQEKRSKQNIKLLFDPSPGQYEIEGTVANIPSYLIHRN